MSGKTFSVNLRRIGACTEGLNNVSDLLEPAAPKTLPMKPQDNKSGSGVKDPDIKTEQAVSTSVKPDGMEIGESIGDASKISLESGTPKILPMKPQDGKSDSGVKGPDIKTEQSASTSIKPNSMEIGENIVDGSKISLESGAPKILPMKPQDGKFDSGVKGPDIKTEQSASTSVKPNSMEIGESIGEGLNIKLEPTETKTLPMKPQDNKSGSGVKGPDIKTEPAVGTSVKPNSMEIGENIGEGLNIKLEPAETKTLPMKPQDDNSGSGAKGPDIKTEPAVGTFVKPNSMEIGENIGDASKISPESGTVTAVKKEVQQKKFGQQKVDRCADRI